MLNSDRVDGICKGLKDIAILDDPVGKNLENGQDQTD